MALMHQAARQVNILKTVTARGSCSVLELARELGVSDETVRRDLKRMAEEGLVRKVHGGVTLPDPLTEPAFQQRLAQQAEAKKAIAAAAAQEVEDGDAIMLDTGSTTAYVAQALRHRRNLLVVTNSVDIARALATRNGNRVFMAGGELRADDGAALGPSATSFLEQFRVRLAVLSIGSIDLEDGFMDYHLHEAELSRVMIRRADHTIIVADHTKFGHRALVTVCPLAAVGTLITDASPPAPFLDRLKEVDARIVVAGHSPGPEVD